MQTSTACFYSQPILVQQFYPWARGQGTGTILLADINTTCTSFVSKHCLSDWRWWIQSGSLWLYRSSGLNPKQKKALNCLVMWAAAFIFEATHEDKGIIAKIMYLVWSMTEIRAGFDSIIRTYPEATKTDLLSLIMKGKKILLFVRVIPEMFQEFQEKSGKMLNYFAPSLIALYHCHGQIGSRQRQAISICQWLVEIWFR